LYSGGAGNLQQARNNSGRIATRRFVERAEGVVDNQATDVLDGAMQNALEKPQNAGNKLAKRQPRNPSRGRIAVSLSLIAGALCCAAGRPALAQDQPGVVSADHAERMAAGLALFKSQVREVLAQMCLDFSIVDREGLLQGGATGPAIAPGNSAESLLLKLISHQDEPAMPFERPKLPDEAIAAISRWIDLGAPYDRPLAETRAAPQGSATVTDDDRQFWSFRPLAPVELPEVQNAAWCRTPVDRFILARLEAEGLHPNPTVERRKLIRRAYLDVIGLLPEPEEVERFCADPDPLAYEKLIDHLLASPHYGERWGRHWLDLARWAESHGYEQDYDRKHAWPYRDFVIRALNDDMPYDRFVQLQVAGDEIEPHNPLALCATGFLGAGTHATQITANQVEKERYDELDDMTGTIGTAVLGLTIGCARCHDHKYDPIPTIDYYRLLSTFTTTVRSEIELDLRSDVERKSQQAALLALRASIDPAWGETVYRIEEPAGRTTVMVTSEGLKPIRLHTQGADFFEETYVLKRGDLAQKLEVARQGFLQVLMPAANAEARWRQVPPDGCRTSYRRRALANWITDVQQGAGALAARVIVNRLWQHHFGRGIVATPSDFGHQGARPTHPELLEWLAGELVAGQWRLKPLHKLMMTSSVYLQSVQSDAARARIDPENRLLWRRNRQRLEAEILRDAMLSASGLLDPTMYGPGTLDESQRRRSIYFFVKRSKLIPLMVLFDAPEALTGIAVRPSTTVAPQALALLNNKEIRRCSEGLADKVMPADDGSISKAIGVACLRTLGRRPTADEQAALEAFFDQQAADYQRHGESDPQRAALVDACQALFCLNEFIYVP
jgi:hypothetical protein